MKGSSILNWIVTLFEKSFMKDLFLLSHTKSGEQLADLFTKSLLGLQHHNLLGKLGVTSCTSSNLGGVGITSA